MFYKNKAFMGQQQYDINIKTYQKISMKNYGIISQYKAQPQKTQQTVYHVLHEENIKAQVLVKVPKINPNKIKHQQPRIQQQQPHIIMRKIPALPQRPPQSFQPIHVLSKLPYILKKPHQPPPMQAVPPLSSPHQLPPMQAVPPLGSPMPNHQNQLGFPIGSAVMQNPNLNGSIQSIIQINQSNLNNSRNSLSNVGTHQEIKNIDGQYEPVIINGDSYNYPSNFVGQRYKRHYNQELIQQQPHPQYMQPQQQLQQAHYQHQLNQNLGQQPYQQYIQPQQLQQTQYQHHLEQQPHQEYVQPQHLQQQQLNSQQFHIKQSELQERLNQQEVHRQQQRQIQQQQYQLQQQAQQIQYQKQQQLQQQQLLHQQQPQILKKESIQPPMGANQVLQPQVIFIDRDLQTYKDAYIGKRHQRVYHQNIYQPMPALATQNANTKSDVSNSSISVVELQPLQPLVLTNTNANPKIENTQQQQSSEISVIEFQAMNPLIF